MSQFKPRGRIGWLALGPAPKFVDIMLPPTKAAIERYIFQRTLDNAQQLGIDLFSLTGPPLQNQEADFDFTLPTVYGNEYLDLVEIMPPNWVRGKHGDAPGSYRNGAFADAVFTVIRAKSVKYGLARGGPTNVHLLLYPTDWRLRISDSVQIILSCRLSHEPLGFKSIVVYQPDDDVNGVVTRLHSQESQQPSALEAESLRSRITLLADLTDFQVEADGSVSARILPPPK